MNRFLITEDIVSSYSICQRKSYQLLLQNNKGKEQIYAVFLRKRIKEVKNLFIQSEKNCLSFSLDSLQGKAEIILDAVINETILLLGEVLGAMSAITSSVSGSSLCSPFFVSHRCAMRSCLLVSICFSQSNSDCLAPVVKAISTSKYSLSHLESLQALNSLVRSSSDKKRVRPLFSGLERISLHGLSVRPYCSLPYSNTEDNAAL